MKTVETNLKKALLLLPLLLIHNSSLANTPTEIAGFVLNSDIAEYESVIKSETIQPIRFNEALSEAEIQNVPGFRSGYIAYGTCASPGKIVRVKLKYKNSSEKYYEELLETYEDRFGKAEWLGDAFHVVSIWKWSFEENGTQVDLYLQHNLGRIDEKLGNSVKMTMLNLVEDERDCFATKFPDYRQSEEADIDEEGIELEELLPK